MGGIGRRAGNREWEWGKNSIRGCHYGTLKKGHVLCLRDHLCYKLVTEGTIL